MKKIVVLLLTLHVLLCSAATVDTVTIYSNAMKKSAACVVIQPQSYAQTAAFPVLYLLHGAGGKYATWIIRVPELQAYADQYQLLIVCPDGSPDSWYFDSKVNPAVRYETYISKEVPAYIDAHYKTKKNRYGRAITGLSMGGHGGLFLGFRHADVFGACGSMSGGVDIRPFAPKWNIQNLTGNPYSAGFDWKDYTVAAAVERYPKDSIAIIFDCGVDDFFYETNKALHQKMLDLKIPHDYTERPGGHAWPYWKNSIQYQLLFFRNYFDEMKARIS